MHCSRPTDTKLSIPDSLSISFFRALESRVGIARFRLLKAIEPLASKLDIESIDILHLLSAGVLSGRGLEFCAASMTDSVCE
jgi:hypothetical protein